MVVEGETTTDMLGVENGACPVWELDESLAELVGQFVAVEFITRGNDLRLAPFVKVWVRALWKRIVNLDLNVLAFVILSHFRSPLVWLAAFDGLAKLVFFLSARLSGGALRRSSCVLLAWSFIPGPRCL
jgi:hypothetical protein